MDTVKKPFLWVWEKTKAAGRWVKTSVKKTLIAVGFVSIASAAGLAVTDARINQYDEFPDRYELGVNQPLPESGQARIIAYKNKPAVAFAKWDYEVQMMVRYKGVIATGSRQILTNDIKWGSGAQEVKAYPIDIEGADGGFEIEVILNSKPATNVFEFEIEGAENLDFFYQPALTQEEIDGGAFQPDNIIGSYAVYHKIKANHQIGSLNYATGKAYHIYRPEVIDADGNRVWAELFYLNGLLSVTVPQSFLDKAVYPVIVDPTIGYTSIGSSISRNTAQNFNNNSHRLAVVHTIPTNGTVDSIHAGLSTSSGTETADHTAFLNEKDSVAAGQHGEIVKVEILNLSVGTAASFKTFTAGSESVTGGTDYLFNIIGDGADVAGSNVNIRLHADRVGEVFNYREFAAGGYSSIRDESPWITTGAINPGSRNVRLYSLYITYTLTATATSPETFNIPGTYIWTVPTGVTSVDVETWGAGGGGGDGSFAGAGGGGGGAFAKSTISVTPDEEITLIVGLGGDIGASASTGTDGADSTFDSTVVVAAGGKGGPGANNADSIGGAGGTTADSTGDTEFAGGSGGGGTNSGDTGGGGGGAGGIDGAGGTGTNGNGTVGGAGGDGDNGSGGAGGAGGNGGNGVEGTNDFTNGGGGGGGGDDGGSGGAGGNGGGGGGGEGNFAGAGGSGLIVLTYTAAEDRRIIIVQ